MMDDDQCQLLPLVDHVTVPWALVRVRTACQVGPATPLLRVCRRDHQQHLLAAAQARQRGAPRDVRPSSSSLCICASWGPRAQLLPPDRWERVVRPPLRASATGRSSGAAHAFKIISSSFGTHDNLRPKLWNLIEILCSTHLAVTKLENFISSRCLCCVKSMSVPNPSHFSRNHSIPFLVEESSLEFLGPDGHALFLW